MRIRQKRDYIDDRKALGGDYKLKGTMMKRVMIIAVLSAFVATMGLSQEFKVRHIKTDVEGFPGIVSAIQVYDTFDEPIIGLKNENFSAAVDKQRSDSVKAITYKEAGRGFDIMLCLDVSGSMQGKPLQTVKNSVKKFIDDMRSIDKVGIISIADDAILVSDFSNDKAYLKSQIDGIRSQGQESAIYYAVHKGIQKLLDVKDKVGKIALLMSDGKNESKSSSYTEDDAIQLANSDGIPIFSIGYTKIDESYLRSLERISEKTGGNYYKSPTDDDLDKCYQKLYRQILNIYLVNYLTVLPADGGEHTAVVSVNHKGSSKSVSSKFLAPANVPAAERKIIIQGGGGSFPTWAYGAIGGGILLVAGIAAFLFYRSKKKKEEDEFRRKEEERQRRAEEESERRKREKASEQQGFSKKPIFEADLPSTPAKAEKTTVHPVKRNDKTMILAGGAPSAKVILDIEMGALQGSRFEIGAEGATIGRAADNSIAVTDTTISGHHAKITCSDGSYMIEDLGSTNGTYINGQKTTIQRLNNGDTFKIGSNEGRITLL